MNEFHSHCNIKLTEMCLPQNCQLPKCHMSIITEKIKDYWGFLQDVLSHTVTDPNFYLGFVLSCLHPSLYHTVDFAKGLSELLPNTSPLCITLARTFDGAIDRVAWMLSAMLDFGLNASQVLGAVGTGGNKTGCLPDSLFVSQFWLSDPWCNLDCAGDRFTDACQVPDLLQAKPH